MGKSTRFESKCKMYSSKLRGARTFISGTDGISIREGIETGLLPLLENGSFELVSDFTTGRANLRFMISVSRL